MNTLVIVGIIALVFGGALIAFRRPLDAWNARTATSMQPAPRADRHSQQGYSTRYIGGVGLLIVIVGIALIIWGLAA
jgi:hypothetical protein